MKLMVASYNNGATNWNAEAEETAFRSYKLDHSFNGPAQAEIVLADPTGAIAQKYNVDANDVFIGPAKVTIEDPDGTDVFYGRILRAEASFQDRQVVLYCRDWLDQLDEEQIIYDMREDLNGSGLRQSALKSDLGDGCWPVSTFVTDSFLYDADMAWANDQFNGMYVFLPLSAYGPITVCTGPYADTMSAEMDTDDGGFDDLWVDDTNYHHMQDNDTSFDVDYDFHVNAGTGSLYSSGPTGGRLELTWYCTTAEADVERNGHIKIKDADENYHTIDQFVYTDDTTDIRRKTILIPEQYLSNFEDTDGTCTIRISVATGLGNTTELNVYYCMLELDYVLSPYSTALLIEDTSAWEGAGNYYMLRIDGVDCNYSGLGLYEGCPYCIAQHIYKHIDSAETPGDLITAGDDIVTLTCAATVEHTSGISTRQYIDRTRLEILRDLAIHDTAVFWIALGGTTVTWKSTFNAGAPAAINDAMVTDWLSRFDYTPMRNNARVYGARIDEEQVFVDTDNAASQLKYRATRSQTVHNTGLVSKYDATQVGAALAARDCEVQQVLSATLPGLDSTYRLGTEVSVTSTWLNLTAVAYVVNRWAYDSTQDLSYVTMYPRSSLSTIGIQPIDSLHTKEQTLQQNVSTTKRDTYVPTPTSNTVV